LNFNLINISKNSCANLSSFEWSIRKQQNSYSLHDAIYLWKSIDYRAWKTFIKINLPSFIRSIIEADGMDNGRSEKV
jgi:hypothetical protein